MDYNMVYSSPIGLLALTSDGKYLTGLSICNSNKNDVYESVDLDIFKDTIKWLDIYFNNEVPKFTPKYKINGSEFQKKVLSFVSLIPYGKTASYKEIAQMFDDKKMSYQAIGRAVGNNPICIIIPCHRVIGSDGKLIGYRYGIETKRKLLEIESN